MDLGEAEIANRWPNVGQFRCILPLMVVGPTTWHLLFGDADLLAIRVPYPKVFGPLDAQLAHVRAAWPPQVQRPYQAISIPYSEILGVWLSGGNSRVVSPFIRFRTVWRPRVVNGQNYRYWWYFQKGPLVPDLEKAEYAKGLLPGILPVPIRLRKF